MELVASIEPFLCPLSAFLDPNDSDFFRLCQTEYEEIGNENRSAILWASSALNPRNRLNAFYSRGYHSWRVNGCAATGRQFFVTSTFLLPALPIKRVDVILPCQSKYPNGLRRMLRALTLYGMSSGSIRGLEIVQYVEQVLFQWSSKLPYFKEIYQALTFGSRIVIKEIVFETNNAKVRLVPNADFTSRDLFPWTLSTASGRCHRTAGHLQSAWQIYDMCPTWTTTSRSYNCRKGMAWN